MCEYQDIQRLKLQEAPENVPTGELPRHVMLSADRGLVGAVVPGTRVTVSGVYSVTAPSGRSRCAPPPPKHGTATTISSDASWVRAPL